MIRVADKRDVDDLLVLMRQFYQGTVSKFFGDFDSDAVRSLFEGLIERDNGLLLISDSKKSGAGYFATPTIWRPDRISVQELFVWVDPSERGKGVGKALLRAGEDWTDEIGAQAMVMAALESSPKKLNQVYSKAGFERVETHWVKVF